MTWEGIATTVGLIGTVIAGVFRSGQLVQRIDNNEKEVHQIKVDVREDIRTLTADVKELNTFLRDAAFASAQAKKSEKH